MTPPDPAPPASQADVARGAGTAFLSRLGAAVEVVAQPAYVAMFGLPTYGLYMTLWAAVNIAQNIADLGMPSALQRLVPQAAHAAGAADALRAALLWGVGPSILFAALACSFAGDLAQVVNADAADRAELATAIALFAWALPLWSVVEVGTAALRAKRAFGPEIRLRVFWEQVARLVVAAGLWAAGVSTLGLIIAHLASLSLTAVATLRLVRRHYALDRWIAPVPLATMREALSAGLTVLPQDITGRLLAEAPPLVLNLWFPGAAGATAAGLYAIARKLSSLVQMVRMAFSYVVAPLASGAVRAGHEALANIYGFATRLTLTLSLPMAAVLIGAGPLVLWPFGPEARDATAAVAALVIARAIESVAGQANAIQSVTGKRTDPLVGSVVGLLLAGGTAPWLVPLLGVTGAAIAVALGIASASLVAMAQLNRRQHLHPFASPFARTATIAAAVSLGGGAVAFAARALPDALGLSTAVALLLQVLWLSARLALGAADKAALGKAAIKLRLGA